MSSTGQPTIADLAQSLGLSKSAVSNALNDRPGVSAATRQRVREAADASGWRPNALARALSTGQAGAFGLCIARDSSVLGSESYYQRVLAGIEEVLIDSEQSLLLRLVGTGGADLDVYRRWAREGRVDAVALMDMQSDDPRLPLVEELGLPAVIQGSIGGYRSAHGAGATPWPVVNGDVDAEAALLVDHLHQRGARRLAFLHGPLNFIHEVGRLAAVCGACESHGVTMRAIETDYSQEAGLHFGNDLVDEGWADAVITSNDLLAVGVARACGDSPTVKIASWDDSQLCAYLRPGITALNRHPQAVGRQVGLMLVHLARREPTQPEATPVTLVVRESTGG